MRFYLYPKTFRNSLLHPTESLFIPASLISLGTVLLNITQYGTTPGKSGHWLLETMYILFWIYCALAVVLSCGIYLAVWSTQTFTIDQMTPIWIFPAYPLLIVGPFAAVLAQHMGTHKALDVIVGGWVFQGIGFLVSLMIYSSFIYRLFTKKLPPESLRPGMFISVGPSGFTIAGVVNMGSVLPSVVTSDFMGNGYLAGQIGKIGATWIGLWLWGLAFWFFLISVGAHWNCVKENRMTFAMNWYSYIFPNTGKSKSWRCTKQTDTNIVFSSHNRNILRRKSAKQHTYPGSGLRTDMSPDHHMGHDLRPHAPSSVIERYSLATETRRSRGRRLEELRQ